MKETYTTKTAKIFIAGSALHEFTRFSKGINYEVISDFSVKDDAINFTITSASKIKILLPCLTIKTDKDYFYYITAADNDDKQVFAKTISFGSNTSIQAENSTNIFTDIDTIFIKEGINTLNITYHLSDAALLSTCDWLLSLSCQTYEEQEHTFSSSQTSSYINIKPKSQMLVPDVGSRICSPTCVSMLLDFYGRQTTPIEVAQRAYYPELDLYGVWPMSLYAASHFNTLGALIFFQDWREAAAILEAGFPIITSIRYGKDELTNCAINRPDAVPKGHLVLLCGFEDNYVIVNDPAASDEAQVVRRYLLSEFIHIWLERSATGYLIW